jgi:hypothetical protein
MPHTSPEFGIRMKGRRRRRAPDGKTRKESVARVCVGALADLPGAKLGDDGERSRRRRRWG